MQTQLEDLLNQVSKSPLIDAGDLVSASELILQAVLSGLKLDRCGIWLFADDNAGIRCFHLIDTLTKATAENLVLYRKDFPQYFTALDAERVIAAHDAREDSATVEFKEVYLDVLGITSMLDTPIRHSGKTVGIICSEHRGLARTWSGDEIVFAGVLSDLFGRAISAREKLDYEKQLKESNQQLEELVQKRTAHLEATIEKMQSLQSQLVESEKMASLGNLVAGVAHEVNTPLGVALTATTHVKDSLSKLDKQFQTQSMTRENLSNFIELSHDALEMAYANLNRAAILISNFKRTSADQNHFEYETIEIKDYCNRVVSTLGSITKKKNVHVTIEGNEIKKETYPGALGQIITNLISNSCLHAFECGFEKNAKIHLCIAEAENGKVKIEFSDNGQGIDAKHLKKIFEPFYTTKRSTGGTGLGLSIVHTMVTQNLKGSIDVQSEASNGTRFTIVF